MLEDLTDAAVSGPISVLVRIILVGAAPLSRRLAAACQRCFPVAAVVSAYGMTEACSSICFRKVALHSLDDDARKTACSALLDHDSSQCVGLPAPGIEVSIDDDTGAWTQRGCDTLLVTAEALTTTV